MSDVDLEEEHWPGPRRRERADRTRRRRRGLMVLGALAILAAPFLIAGAWFWWQVSPPGGQGAAVTVDIPTGTGISGIGDRLHGAGVVGSSLAFRLYAEVTGGGPYQSGQYELRKHMGARAAAHALARGPSVEHLPLPPGLTLEQIAARVGTVRGLSADKFLAAARSGTVRSKYEPPGVSSLEGLTFPDTYLVTRGQTEEQVLRMLVRRFDQEADAAGLARGGPRGMSAYQAIVVASLIETEAKLDVDRPLIAAVVYNRIHDGMALQIDATVKYARGGGDGPLTNADFARSSPYNTYKVKGLPPTPISTVSLASLRAALAPADAPYLYYVLIDQSGKHAFATTYQQHLKNVAEARQKGLL